MGIIEGLDTKVLGFFPEYRYPGMDDRKYDITIQHLLTMRMGIQGEADDDYGVFWSLYNSPDWIKATIEMPLLSAPGEKMRYNTFQTHLLSGVITRAAAKNTLDFANQVLFGPMEIDVDAWQQDPQGIYFGGTNMWVTPREMAKLGFLYLNRGRLNGRQIVPEAWVDLTLTASTNNTHPNAWGAWKNYNYAWLWWLGQMNGHDMFLAYGYGGQFVAVFPDLDLIIVTTADYQVDGDTSTVQEWAIFDIMTQTVLPAIIE